MGSYQKPYTNDGNYNPGSSGLSEQDFLFQRQHGLLSQQNGGNPYGTKTDGMDYNAGGLPSYQSLPATNQGLGDTGNLAPALQGQTLANRNNFRFGQNSIYGHFNQNQGGLTGSLASMYQGQQALQNGPGNAFSKGDLQNMHAMGLGQLQGANRAAMVGLAGANSSRGVAGNSIGGIMGQQLGVSQAGALAQGDLAARQKGLELGNQQYQSRSAVANNLGTLLNQQEQRNYGAQENIFKSFQDEKQNAYSDLQEAQKAYNNLRQQYLVQASTSPGGSNGKQIKDYIRQAFEDARRNLAAMRIQYNRYNDADNQYYTPTITSGPAF